MCVCGGRTWGVLGPFTAWLATRHTMWRGDKRLVCVLCVWKEDFERGDLWGYLLPGWQPGTRSGEKIGWYVCVIFFVCRYGEGGVVGPATFWLATRPTSGPCRFASEEGRSLASQLVCPPFCALE